MAKVFREITVNFDGADYTFTPSNKLLRSIDAGLSPSTLLGVANVMNGQQLPLYDIAYITSRFIEAGGGDASEDDVLDELHADLAENDGNGIKGLVEAIGVVLTPPDAAKNRPAPAKKSGAKRK